MPNTTRSSASVRDRRAARTRTTAAEVREFFDVPCEPLLFGTKLGAGAFGAVFRSRMPSGRVVAIRQVVEDPNYVNREVEVHKLLEAGNHPNIRVVEPLGVYYTLDQQRCTMNLVIECVPQSLRSVLLYPDNRGKRMKAWHVQCNMSQLSRALLFMHQQDILHRDLKPKNILINPETHVLKLADFDSAKKIITGRTNVTYICSRFYRAPEPIFGSCSLWSGN